MKEFRTWLCVVALGLAAGAVAAEEKAEGAKDSRGTIVHSVYFWLKDTATKEDAASLVADIKDLGKLECVKQLDVGTPLPKAGGPVADSYSVALVAYFADQAAYDAYSKDPKHTALIEKHKALWQKVVVYDFVRK